MSSEEAKWFSEEAMQIGKELGCSKGQQLALGLGPILCELIEEVCKYWDYCERAMSIEGMWYSAC